VRVEEAGELHGQRRATEGEAAADGVEADRARDADRIDARMPPEPAVLRGECGVDEVRGDPVERDPGLAPAGGGRVLAQHAAGGVEDGERGGRARREARPRVRPRAHRDPPQRRRQDDERHERDRRPLAEPERPLHFSRTTKVEGAVRAITAGSYISPADSPGTWYVPAVVARAR